MTIKLVAVDMDGSFLDSTKNYDRKRFAVQYQALKRKGVRFVVASGNQYCQLRSFFPDIADEISYAAENGAHVWCEGQELFFGELPREAMDKVIDALQNLPLGASFVVCARNGAYMHEQFFDLAHALFKRQYHKLTVIRDYRDIEDAVFKFALHLPSAGVQVQSDNSAHRFVQNLEQQLHGLVTPVFSAACYVDLNLPGLNKASGLRRLMQRWGVADDEVAAFGDAANDLEMIAGAGYGVAMGNAIASIKQVARYHTHSNDEDGVLNALDLIIEAQHPFQ